MVVPGSVAAAVSADSDPCPGVAAAAAVDHLGSSWHAVTERATAGWCC